ncbi:hypothetical protein AVEN_82999-1 [Araneus ventricosus]|uniref:Uncharacterized protein n=1 Tax=Araneus ventricosus TaxID=182803 RepID=A0A4Y2GNP1_ARAVE|nr:hypothetical protein AVEN_82999-1 [Araneus ventricosus]
MSPLTLKKSRASKGSVSKVSLDRRRQERMCFADALATPHFAQTGNTLLPWLKEQRSSSATDSSNEEDENETEDDECQHELKLFASAASEPGPGPSKAKRGRMDTITPKLTTVLDRTKVSDTVKPL